MKKDFETYMNRDGLAFFGKVNASISHELKNIFAIISETAGFLTDLTDLAKQGKNIELSTLDHCCQSITEEIQRGFAAIKQMNKLAHSVDQTVSEFNFFEIFDLGVQLAGFLSFAGKVRIDQKEKELILHTSPFVLLNLLYQVLYCIYKSIGVKAVIDVKVRLERNKISADFDFRESSTLDKALMDDIRDLAGMLEADVYQVDGQKRIKLLIPLMNE